MPRSQNKLQESYEFSCEIPLRLSDINFAGHVDNARMISLAHEGRAKAFNALGMTEIDLGDGRTGILVADITANLKAEIFLDDEVVVKTHLGEIGEKSLRTFHCIEKNGEVAALIESGLVCFDYIDRKVSAIPERFREKLGQYLKQI